VDNLAMVENERITGCSLLYSPSKPEIINEGKSSYHKAKPFHNLCALLQNIQALCLTRPTFFGKSEKLKSSAQKF
jgi:hypothetical protein